jgi:hypothetical protein
VTNVPIIYNTNLLLHLHVLFFFLEDRSNRSLRSAYDSLQSLIPSSQHLKARVHLSNIQRIQFICLKEPLLQSKENLLILHGENTALY